MNPTTHTGNGSLAYEHSTNHLLEFFSKAGSIKKTNTTFYPHLSTNIKDLFKSAWYTGDSETCMKLLFWVRDCRGGAGARQNFRDCIKWLANTSPEWVKANINLIPKYGRWDDLKCLYDTPCEKDALKLWCEAISYPNPDNHLAAKWADRQDYKLRKFMYLTPKAFRKLLVYRTKWIVEHDMCSNNWKNIEYQKIPSVATARYTSAFERHDTERFKTHVYNISCGKEKINTKALFPHDVIRMTHKESLNDTIITQINNAFNNLPNYISDPNVRIMSICDFSGSMATKVSGSISALDVCLGLGLYCSDRLGKDNPFYRKLIPFSTRAKLESWVNDSFFEATRKIPNGYIGSTNIESALNVLLSSAQFWGVKKEQMVNTLLIMSDMQFDEATTNSNNTIIEDCLELWEQAGYDRPKIVFWNLHAYNNQPSTANKEGIAMISGFSPAILKSVLSLKDFNPVDIMLEVLNKYDIVKP